MGQFITPDVLPPDTFCRRLLIPNDPKWIGIVSGALLPMVYASEWVSYGGITPEQAAERANTMLQEFWASNGCEDDMNCCDDQIRIKRFDPVTGRPQISLDNGVTWQGDPNDTQNQIQLMPPIVTEGSSSTKCDAATNASEHINELIDATGEQLSTASTIFALAVGIAEAILALFLILVSAGTLTAPVTAVATAIWAAATSLFNLGIEAYEAYWTVDKKDAILCALYCNIGDNGQFTEEQYQAFRTKVKEQLPASPALDIVMTSINAGGATGLSQMASYGNAALADCSSCDCGEGCGNEWHIRDGLAIFGTIVSQDATQITVTTNVINTNNVWYCDIQTIDPSVGCYVNSIEILSGSGVGTAYRVVPNTGEPGFGLGPIGACCNELQPQSENPFTIRFNLDACPPT